MPVLNDFVMDKVHGYSLYGETFLCLFLLRLASSVNGKQLAVTHCI